MPILVDVGGVDEFRALSRRLKEQGRGDLGRKLRQNIRRAARPAEADLRSAVMRVEVTSSRGGTARPDTSTGLRARTARAIGTSITQNGVRIKVNQARVGPYGASLPKYLDASLARYSRWRHPVFGNRNVYAEQSGSGWFFETIYQHRADFRQAVLDAMDDIANELT